MVDSLDAYDEQGFVHVPGVFAPDEVARMAEELERICRWVYGPVRGGPAPRPEASAAELLSQAVAVHFPHKRSPWIRDLITDPRLVELFTALVGPNVKCVQSMFFIRPPGGPGQAWHQDEHYIPSRDRSVTAAWIAVDAADEANGCLRFLPGSHRRGILWPHGPHGDEDFDPVGEAQHHPYGEEDAVVVEAAPGDVVLFHGYLLHRSGPNRTADRFRRALAFHAARAESLMPWMGAERRGPIGGADHRDFVMVAGEDPYPWADRVDEDATWMRPAKL